jgi:hypothetical protein
MQTMFVLDHEAAKNELSRSLQTAIQAIQRLPRDAPTEMEELVARDFKELINQSRLTYQWLVEVRTRIDLMTKNLNTKGVTGFEK